MLLRECAEALAGCVVWTERLFVPVLRVRRDLLRDGADLGSECVVMRRVAQQRLDPALRAVVGGDVVLEQELPEDETAADIGERAEGEDPVRRRDELSDV